MISCKSARTVKAIRSDGGAGGLWLTGYVRLVSRPESAALAIWGIRGRGCRCHGGGLFHDTTGCYSREIKYWR